MVLNSKLIGLGRSCQEQCFISRSIWALFLSIIKCVSGCKGESGGRRLRLCSRIVGRLLPPPGLGHPGHWSGWSDPLAGVRENSKGRLALERLWEKCSKHRPLSLPCMSNGCLISSKTDRALGLWSHTLPDSSLSLVKLSKAFLEIKNHLEI